MADQKITELTELSTPEANDLLVIVDDPSGTPVTKKITVGNVIVDATTTVKGKASFNSDDFSVSSGAVSLKNKTSYVSISGASFKPTHPDTDSHDHTVESGAFIDPGVGLVVVATVQIPHGAVVTGAVVYASGTLTWELFRVALSDGSTSLMATASANSEDTSISNATIDNSTYTYVFNIDDAASRTIYGARVKYTTDYD